MTTVLVGILCRYFVSVFCVGILALALVQCSRLVGLTAVVGFLAPTAHCHCNQSSDYVLEWWKLVRVTMAKMHNTGDDFNCRFERGLQHVRVCCSNTVIM